jgi:hypothetical protein
MTKLAATIALLASCLALPARAAEPEPRASGLMRSQLGEVATNIKKFLAGRNEDTVAIGAFTGPANLATSAGPGLARVLAEELERAGIRIKRQAKIGLSGTYRPVEEKANQEGSNEPFTDLRVVVKTRVEDETGKVLVEFEKTAYDVAEVGTLLGLTYNRPRNALDSQKQENYRVSAAALIDGLKRPSVAVAGSVVRSAAGSPYGVELLIKGRDGQYRPRAARAEDGLAFVPISRGEVYAVRLTNRTPFEAACELNIDGLSTFAFSELRQARRWIIPPNQIVTVVGWHISQREANEFLITEYAKTAVAELGASPASIGTITAQFTACWEKGRDPPEGDPQPLRIARPGAGMVETSSDLPAPQGGVNRPDGTARGEKVEVKTEVVTRDFGVTRSIVSIRYSK